MPESTLSYSQVHWLPDHVFHGDLQTPLEAVFRAPPASPALALPLAFLTVNLIPQWEHHKRNSNRLTNGLFWLFVGTLLVLFTHQIIP